MTNLLAGVKSMGSPAYVYFWVSSFLVTLLVGYLLSKLGRRVGFVDDPASSARKIHLAGKPVGGLAVYLGFVPVYVLAARHPLPLALGLSIVFVTGLVDDLWKLSPKTKLLLQLAAGGTFVGLAPVPDTTLGLTGGWSVTLPAFLNYAFVVFWLVGGTNAVNLIDGLDGLATGLALIAVVPLFLFSGGGETLLLLGLALSALVGFLLFNFHPARLFLGDEGSYFIGFLVSYAVIAGLTHVGPAGNPEWNLIPGLLFVGVPVLDTGWAILRRVRSGKGIMEPDSGHLHHRLFYRYGHLPAVLAIYGLQGGLALAGVLWVLC